jgi:hypothetical protein
MNQIRFTAVEGKKLVGQTEWLDEFGPKDAPAALAEFRAKLGGNYAYMIERRGDSKIPNKIQLYRCHIKVGDNVYYSRVFNETERDAVMGQIREEFPQAQLTEEAL